MLSLWWNPSVEEGNAFVPTPTPLNSISSINELSGAPKLEPELRVKRMGFGAISLSVWFHDLGRAIELLGPKFIKQEI